MFIRKSDCEALARMKITVQLEKINDVSLSVQFEWLTSSLSLGESIA